MMTMKTPRHAAGSRAGVPGARILLAAAALLCAASASAQFEGTVRMRTVTYGDADSSVILPTAHFKESLFEARIDAPPDAQAPPGRFILRGDRGVMWIVIDSEKKYIEIPVTPTGAAPDSGAGGRTYTLSRSGETDTLLGYPCEEWIADEGSETVSRIWATASLAGLYEGIVRWFDGMSLEIADDRGRWQREMARAGLFPLLVLRSEEGELVEREEVVAVEKQPVPEAIFAEPAGYEKQAINPDFEKVFERMMEEMEQDEEPDTSDGGSSGGEENDGGVHL